MKITDLWSEGKKPSLSFELFPAHSEKGKVNLDKAIFNLADLSPDFFSVTFGAGGSTRAGSRKLVEKLIHKLGFNVLAYFACYGLSPGENEDVLKDYRNLGVENILAVRGDEPRDKNFKPHPDSFLHATDLLAFIRPRYDFCMGVAGYPEGHIDAESKDKDLEYLKMKIDLGAEFVITNYFYDNKYFFDFVKRCRAVEINVPIIPGIMPIYSVKMMKMLSGMCGATIVDEIKNSIAAIPDGDTNALNDFGVDFATRQCEILLESGVPGLHIYTMDRSKSAVALVKRLRDKNLV